MNFGERLYTIRKEKKITQDQLSEKIKVSRQAISKWENGEAVPDINKLVLLASVLDMTTDELCGLENNKEVVENKPVKKTNKLIYAIVILACLCIGVVMGLGLGSNKEEPITLPEAISVSVYDIGRTSDDTLMLYFVPSATSEKYEYKITCYGTNKEALEFPASYDKGMVSSELKLPKNVPFLIIGTVTVGNQARNFLITQGFVHNETVQSFE